MTKEIQSGTPTLTGAEQTVATLAAWHQWVDVYVDPSNEKNAVGSVWRVYSNVGGVRALIGGGTIKQSATPVRVVERLAGTGSTIELAVASPQGPSVGPVKAAIVGYSDTDAAGEAAAAASVNLTQVDQDVAAIAWFPRVDVTVKGNGDPLALRSIWDLYAVLPGFNCLVASAVLQSADIQTGLIPGIVGGASSWLLRARSTIGSSALLVTGALTGTGNGSAGGAAGGVLAGTFPNPTFAPVVTWGPVQSENDFAVATVDATVTLLATIPMVDEKGTTLDFIVKGKNRANGQTFSKQYHLDYSRTAGGAPVPAANPDIGANNVGAPTWPGSTIVDTATGTTVKVQGVAATNIDWSLVLQKVAVP